ncbi:MAG: arylamine N-acetyltransferase family protein, partial [Stackebrandtia sp.]
PFPPRTDAGTLHRIYRAWRTRIPYENFDLQLGRPITLDPRKLLDKFGPRRRGGTCFQMNGALGVLLRELGFEVSIVEGAVLREKRGDEAWGNHIALLVHLEGERRLADVGIGDSFLEPLRLVEGPQRQDGAEYRLEHLDTDTWRVHHRPGGSVPSWDLRTTARTLAEFAGNARQSHPALHRVLVAQHHRDGRELSLRSRVYAQTGPHGTRQHVIGSRREFVDTLRRLRIQVADFSTAELDTLWDRTAAQYHDWLAIQAASRG